MKRDKEIQAADIWESGKMNSLKDFILTHSSKQTKERKLRNELLAIQYHLEDYINNNVEVAQKMQVLDFVKMYLKALNVTQVDLANLFEIQSSNLHKYLNGERKLSKDIVLKLSAFSHTDPECWWRIEIKNELLEI